MQQVRLALAAAFALTPAVAASSTWVVDPSSSIQAAIDRAQPGDLVVVLPGDYHERLVLRDGVSLAAQTPGTVTVDAEAEGTAVTAIGVSSATVVSGFVFTHGSAMEGGGLYGQAIDVLFSQCTFVDNSAATGGGAYLRDGSRASFFNCSFTGNAATIGGGMYLDFAPVQLSSSTLNGNYARDGAGLSANNAAEARISYTSFYANVASTGTVVACNLASPQFTNCTLASNTGTAGAFGLRGSGARLERCIVSYNSGPAFACAGFNSPWVGCNLVFGNGGDAICTGDQGTNLFLDPRFCNRVEYDFKLAEDSPAASNPCGFLGAQPVACPAQGAETSVRALSWSGVKKLYRD